MRHTRRPSFSTMLATVAAGVALAALAYERPWKRCFATTNPEDSSAVAASPSESAAMASNPAVAAAAPSHEIRRAASSKVIGTIVNVDAPNHRFILKTSGGKSEAFRFAASSAVLRHRRKSAFSALKTGESVIVQRRPGSNAAVRVYVLGDDKS